ncbi:MAG: hypothetical protein FJW95_09435 [Actinobacteria bacterium]|nr:hypothetical protein [Actinomycetota bacterium]
MARRSLILWVVALALLASACSVDTTVTVKVREDGSGFVRVDVAADAEAVQQAQVGGGTLEDRVRLSDLTAAGWTVEPWVRNLDGSASLSLSKPFTSVDQVSGILAELSGDAGPLQSSEFTRDRSVFSTKTAATATVDLDAMTTGILADTDLVNSLQAQGLDVAVVDQQLAAQLRDAFHLKVVLEVPDGQRTVVEVEPGAPATVAASASVLDTRRILFTVLALVLLAGVVVVLVWPRKRVRRRRHEATAATYRRAAAEHRPLSWDEATRERTPPPSRSPGPPPRRRHH